MSSMSSLSTTTPSPVEEADVRRLLATPALDAERRDDLGQFLTPAPVARLMASMFDQMPSAVRLLDAGAGTGSLTAAVVEEVLTHTAQPSSIEVTAFEIESSLTPHLSDTLHRCALASADVGVNFTSCAREEDFIEAAVATLSGDLFAGESLNFNAVIMNPPYRKIATKSRERRLLKQAGLDATNLYAAFVALAIRLLEPGGQAVVIIPRSFCNGPYFRPFREVLLEEAKICRIHVFDSRREAFKDDGVLQENVILHFEKSREKPTEVIVSASANTEATFRSRALPYDAVVCHRHGDNFVHLPTDDTDDAVSTWMRALPASLKDLGLTVSTGRVVDFRARQWLRDEPEAGAVPLIYPCHFEAGGVAWPKTGSRKPNAIVATEDSAFLLVPSGHYVLTKRFTSKEERRRVVAVVFDPSLVPADSIGFENHVNYFHMGGSGLDSDIAYGLAVYLNSTAVDRYFRQFNGHTQVNATDLRSLWYPDIETLREFGRASLSGATGGQDSVDALVLTRFPLPEEDSSVA